MIHPTYVNTSSNQPANVEREFKELQYMLKSDIQGSLIALPVIVVVLIVHWISSLQNTIATAAVGLLIIVVSLVFLMYYRKTKNKPWERENGETDLEYFGRINTFIKKRKNFLSRLSLYFTPIVVILLNVASKTDANSTFRDLFGELGYNILMSSFFFSLTLIIAAFITDNFRFGQLEEKLDSIEKILK